MYIQTSRHDSIKQKSCFYINSVNGGVKTGHGAEQKSATVAPA